MATRKYFVHHAVIVPKVKKPKRPNHKGKLVMVEIKPGLWRTMSSRQLALQLGRSKGGLTAATRGTAYRWTSEEATKAIKKCWKKRWGKGSRIGVRLGRPAKLRPAVDRAALRLQYTYRPGTIIEDHTVEYYGLVEGKHLWSFTRGNCTRQISEKTALTRLGYIAGLHAHVPRGKVIPVPGRRIADSQGVKEEK